MASWLGGGGGAGKSGAGSSSSHPKLTASSASASAKPAKKKERWLVTRKTWRYMADAGKLLIPESLRKGRDYKDYSEDDLRLLEEHYHNVCDQQKEFIIWEGPVEDPRVLLAKNRKAPSLSVSSSDRTDRDDSLADQQSEEGSSSDYRYESHSAKFRIVLPAGEKPPSSNYVQDACGAGDWSFSDNSGCMSPMDDSGILSPSGDYLLSPRDHSPSFSEVDCSDEAGPGSGLKAASAGELAGAGESGSDSERNFFTHLYGGEAVSLDTSQVPEDYYTYLEGWYRSQVKGPAALPHPPAATAGSSGGGKQQHGGGGATSLMTSLMTSSSTTTTSTGAQPQQQLTSLASLSGQTFGAAAQLGGGQGGPPSASGGTNVFIPVSALQSLRASFPGQLPQLAGQGGAAALGGRSVSAGASTTSIPTCGTATMSSSAASQQSSLSFLSSVMSRGRSSSSHQQTGLSSSGLGSSNSTASGSSSTASTASGSANKIKNKLWRQRSKSSSRPANLVASPWSPQDGCTWRHVTGQVVTLQDSTLLHLLEIERIFLQKQAQACLTGFDLGTIVRIPKDNCDRGDRSEMSKTRRRAHLLKKKVLSASSLGGRTEKDKDSKRGPEGAVFGVPIMQCIESARKRSTTDIPSDEVTSPTSKSSRSDSRTSFGSIFETPLKEKSDRICSPLHSTGSCESLNLDLRRSSLAADSQSGLDTLSYSSCDRLLEAPGSDPSDRINPQPCVPSIVNTCIKYLELHGLHTVGIFRVGTSKKRVRQLREDFDSGVEVILTQEVSVHDVATLLKEFFRDLPEPLIPREIYHPLLAVQKIRNRRQQVEALKRVIQLLPQVNRDTLYVLVNFLHLVAENSEDRKGNQGEDITGNKMDSNNLATLFAPNILHSMKTVDGATSPENAAKAAERTETINIVRSLIDYNRELFELNAEDLHQLYLKMNDEVPEAMDYQLRRRAIMNGDEFLEDFESNVIYDMPEPRLLGPHDSHMLDQVHERIRKKEDDERGRARRRGSEDAPDKSGSWFRLRDKSEKSSVSARTMSTESVTGSSTAGKASKKEHRANVVTGSLRINMGGLASATTSTTSHDLDQEDEREDKKKKAPNAKKVVMRRLSQECDGRILSCEVHLPAPSSAAGTGHVVRGQQQGPPTAASSSGNIFSFSAVQQHHAAGSGSSTPSNPFSPVQLLPPGTPIVYSPPPSPMGAASTTQSSSQSSGYGTDKTKASSSSILGYQTTGGKASDGYSMEIEAKYQNSPGGDKVNGRKGKGAADSKADDQQDVSLVLKPVPVRSNSSGSSGGGGYSSSNTNNNKPSPADSVKTLVNEPIPELGGPLNINPSGGQSQGSGELSGGSSHRGVSPHYTAGGLRRLKDNDQHHLLASSSLSLPPETYGYYGSASSSPSSSSYFFSSGANNRLSAFSSDMRSKTDNLERLISEVERSEATGTKSSSQQRLSCDNVCSAGSSNGGGREIKKYIRRRYTDSRHPTTELPDVRTSEDSSDLPSVQNPPVRKVKSKQNLLDAPSTTTTGSSSTAGGVTMSRSTTAVHDTGKEKEQQARLSAESLLAGGVADRPSYKRWQSSSRFTDKD